MPAPRILIVEDEFLIRATLADMLADSGYDVVEAETGDAALVLLQNDSTIALVVTDMQLPGALNGIGLADAARGCRPGMPVVFVTGRPDMVSADEANGIAVVGKPYSGSEITAAVERVLATAAARRQDGASI